MSGNFVRKWVETEVLSLPPSIDTHVTHVQALMQMNTNTHKHTHAHIHTHTHTYAHTHTHTHIHIHTHTHTHHCSPEKMNSAPVHNLMTSMRQYSKPMTSYSVLRGGHVYVRMYIRTYAHTHALVANEQ